LRLCALESGRRRPDRAHDALRPVRSEGILVKDHSRERVLGGASTTWAGLSAPLDPIDLQPRPWLGTQGWPLTRDELVPFWAAAAERYRFAPPALFGPDGFGALRARGDWQGDWREVEEKVFLAASEPQDFGREQRALWEGPAVDLYLDATVLRLSGAEGRVTHALLRNAAGRELQLRARVFVLATGGLENARLLLLSRDLSPAGLGNEHDQVGRWLMNHPKNYRGTIRLQRPLRELPYYLGCLHRGYAGYAGLRLREELQRERGLLNCYVRLEPLYPWTDSRGVEALVSLVKRSRGLLARWKAARAEEVVALRDWSETGDESELQAERTGVVHVLRLLGLVLLHLPTVTRYAVARVSHGRAPPIRAVRLRNFLEMQPRAENRVTLGDARDPAGLPVTVVAHDSGPLDRRSLLELQRVLGEELRRSGLGELESDLASAQPWPIDQDASHHLGTTRMGEDPRTSVVDSNLALHAAPNVFCAGGSVFPTSGCANPTYTIVALSIRLAQHLRTAVFGLPPAAAAPRRGPPPPAPPGAGPPRRVLVVGAGKRVETDVLPALLAAGGSWQVQRVLARGARRLEVAGSRFDVAPLDSLTQADLDACQLLYLAVSKDAVPAALARLTRHDVSRLDLLIDTPVLLPKHLAQRRRLQAFRNVWVAEDCVALPWLDALRAAGATPTEALFDRSAWRYHGLALAKTVLGCRTLVAARRTPVKGGARVELELANGARATILEPRDYRAGHLELRGPFGVVSDDARIAGATLLAPVSERGACAGFACGDAFAPLDAAERWLFGPLQPGESVTARTEDAKRVGLLRLLRDVHAGRGAWPLDEGLEDSLVDWLLEKRGRWKPGLLSVKSRAGMRFLSLVTRPLG
ncbi:MAG TPA: GMC family oxidoreductase, partial [Planctomycetota bacterium]|nr:GMC family oxidoreductase [Planctomycetota bacterium]